MDKPVCQVLFTHPHFAPTIEAYGDAMAAWGAAQEREKVAKEIDKLECELGESDSAFQNECIKNTRLREQLRIVAGFVGDPIKEIPKDTMSAAHGEAMAKWGAEQERERLSANLRDIREAIKTAEHGKIDHDHT